MTFWVFNTERIIRINAQNITNRNDMVSASNKELLKTQAHAYCTVKCIQSGSLL